MSILIKGMEMPEDDDIVICIRTNGDVYTLDTDKDIFFINEAEACKIPTPHGRLIDAEKLPVRDVSRDYYEVMGVTEEDIDDAPTVIEAEEQEHE